MSETDSRTIGGRPKTLGDVATHQFGTTKYAVLKDGVQRTYVRNVEPIYKALGIQIQHHRELAGLSQTQLAKKIGQTRSNIANMETGNQRIPLHIIPKLSLALRIAPDRLMKGLWS